MTKSQVVDLYFLDARHRLIEIAAFLDRLERAEGLDDFRIRAFHEALGLLVKAGSDKTRRVLEELSDPTAEPLGQAASKSACGAWAGENV
jgi:hypothetical protein